MAEELTSNANRSGSTPSLWLSLESVWCYRLTKFSSDVGEIELRKTDADDDTAADDAEMECKDEKAAKAEKEEVEEEKEEVKEKAEREEVEEEKEVEEKAEEEEVEEKEEEEVEKTEKAEKD